MIPLKEEPTVNATLCFSDEDAKVLASCQSHIALAGNVILASARHENLLAHYTRTLLAGLNGFGEKSVVIHRMPKSSDGLLDRLNEHLANLDISTLQTKRVTKTREIWLYELPGPAESELLQMAAKMMTNPGAIQAPTILKSLSTFLIRSSFFLFLNSLPT